MKTIIILSCLNVLLLVFLIILAVHIKKTKDMLKIATAAFNNAQVSLLECVENIKRDINVHINNADVRLKELMDSAEKRFNTNASTIGDKLTNNGFTVEKK